MVPLGPRIILGSEANTGMRVKYITQQRYTYMSVPAKRLSNPLLLHLGMKKLRYTSPMHDISTISPKYLMRLLYNPIHLETKALPPHSCDIIAGMEKTVRKNDVFSDFRVMLAPMAGFSDSSFRAVCMSLGADACVSEMISAKALRLGDKKSPLLMRFKEAERPFGIQLFGADPEDIAFGARFAEENYAPDFIDINMGCPAPKITGSGAGSKLMTDPVLSGEIVAAAVSAVSLPISCKIRAGFHETNADSFSEVLEKNGASCIFIHGRTRDRMYSPPVDLDIIRRVKEAVSIPVLGNGDIVSAEDAVRMLEETSCDGVMIGRGCLGDPFLFGRIKAAMNGHPVPDEPNLEEKMDILMRQARYSVEEKGEHIAMHEMRKQAVYYFKGVNGAASLRADCVRLETLKDLESLCNRALNA